MYVRMSCLVYTLPVSRGAGIGQKDGNPRQFGRPPAHQLLLAARLTPADILNTVSIVLRWYFKSTQISAIFK